MFSMFMRKKTNEIKVNFGNRWFIFVPMTNQAQICTDNIITDNKDDFYYFSFISMTN